MPETARFAQNVATYAQCVRRYGSRAWTGTGAGGGDQAVDTSLPFKTEGGVITTRTPTRFGRARRVALATALLAAAGSGLPSNAADDNPQGPRPPSTALAGASCGDDTNTERILILGETISFVGGCGSYDAQAAIARGLAVDIATDEDWAAMTTADFAAYRAIILSDNSCSGGLEQIDAAENTVATWTPAITGNVVVIGTDENFHTGGERGEALTDKSVGFVTADAAKTGALISLSCYYHYFSPADTPTPVRVLSGFGLFNTLRTAAISEDDCFNDAHIVATHPALAGLTDANLSNWGCSVHEAFSDWPISFEVLAIAENIGTEFFTATDGTSGAPYILARGVQVISDITLSPETATNPLGEPHTLTANVTQDDVPVEGTTVTFTVIDGPCAETTGTDDTDEAGNATFTYTCNTAGTDTIEATFVDSQERTQRSNRVTKTWEEGPPPEEICGNGIDDNDDGITDGPDCPEGPFGDPTCDDGFDNDGDTLFDTDDPDCAPPPVEICGNGIDDNDDGITDGLDNDGDGQPDGEDPDCEGPPPVFDPCSDEGLLTDPTLAQTLWESDLGQGLLKPLLQDPDADGPISGFVEGLRPGDGGFLDLLIHDGACAINLPVLNL
jgi:hypothetical protein